MAFNKTTLRTDIRRFFKDMTNNAYFLNGAFVLYQNATRPTKADCAGRNLFYCYVDGRTDSEDSNTTDTISANVVIGILRAEQEVMGVNQTVFDNTWSRFQTYLTRAAMRYTWVGVPSVMGTSTPFTFGSLGILDIRHFGGDRPLEIGKCGALRYEMIIEMKFNFNNT